jgi:hypothetical protein
MIGHIVQRKMDHQAHKARAKARRHARLQREMASYGAWRRQRAAARLPAAWRTPVRAQVHLPPAGEIALGLLGRVVR